MNYLKKIRVERGLSQFGLAKIANITPGDISRMENEKLYAHPGWRKRLSTALGVSEQEIWPDVQKVG